MHGEQLAGEGIVFPEHRMQRCPAVVGAGVAGTVLLYGPEVLRTVRAPLHTQTALRHQRHPESGRAGGKHTVEPERKKQGGEERARE